ncbi:YihY/virulence factor BrkB family protein [Sorangium sp. So ce1099]|uniref:YihY/virulence factor BrkB family protein n=1 Tax=Sorangium sp. So ce1099 TaxID=3133331 RepID=UPI003F60E026
MHLPGKEIPWKDFLNDIKQEWVKDKVDTVAAALAFFGVLAIFPFLLFAVALAGLVIEPAQSAQLIRELYQVAPPAVANILGERLRALTEGQSPGLLTLGALGAVWAASGGVIALMDALNSAYGVEDSRSFLKRRGISLLVTLGGAILLAIASALTVAAPAVAEHLGPFGTLLLWLRVPVSALIVMAVLATLYYVLPDVEQKFKFITPGSVVAVVIWILASLGFSFYVSRFGSYEVSYGALGGVIVLLLWSWISSMAVLLGAEINAIIEHRSPDGKRTGAKDASDTGPDVPKTEKEEGRGAALPAGGARPSRDKGAGGDVALPHPIRSNRSEVHHGGRA